MITSNFKKLLANINQMEYTTKTSGSALFTLTHSMYNTGNSEVTQVTITNVNYFNRIMRTAANLFSETTGGSEGDAWLLVGTGTTSPTADDYALAAPLLTDLTNVSTGVTKTFADGVEKYTITRTFTYTGETDVDISEAGIFQKTVAGVFLLAREVFAPVTIHNGDTFTVTMSICF